MVSERVDRKICSRLRSKGMFIETEPDTTVPNMSDGFCWCNHTMNCMGPDGSVVSRESCREGRSCFEKR
jgi:hypothetical protein